MRSTFFGMELARLGLWANQRAMETAGHNVANANTPGYRRQVAAFGANAPHAVLSQGGHGWHQLGTGVVIDRIEHLRDVFTDRQILAAEADKEGWTLRRQILAQIETLLNEPSDDGIRGALDRWWDALATLTNEPESFAARTSLVERTETLMAAFRDTDQRLSHLESQLTMEVADRVAAVNRLGERIDDLNRRIVSAEARGGQANDLRDQRDLLVNELAGHVQLSVQEVNSGALRVTVGGVDLVGEGGARTVDLQDDQEPPRLIWTDIQREVRAGGGAVVGALQLLQEDLPQQRVQLLDMARALTGAVNDIHHQGYGLEDDPEAPPPERSFFWPEDTDDENWRLDQWQLNPTIRNDPQHIAASLSGQPGDAANAHALLALQQDKFLNGTTLDEHYRAWVSGIGAASREAQQMERNQELLLNQLQQQRQQTSGVSIDEEMALMLQYRQAYNASARVMTNVDEMLDTLINRTGLAGR